MTDAAGATAIEALRAAARAAQSGAPGTTPRIGLSLPPELASSVGSVAQPGGALGHLGSVPVFAWVRPPAVGGVEGGCEARVARLLGARAVVVALLVRPLGDPPASGVGVLEDHVGFLVPNPLTGPNLEAFGPRFPDLTAAYDPALRACARDEAARAGLALPGGVYAALRDPEHTPDRVLDRLRGAGVTWIGSGGVADVIVARHAGLRVLGLACVAGAEERSAVLIRAVAQALGASAGPSLDPWAGEALE